MVSPGGTGGAHRQDWAAAQVNGGTSSDGTERILEYPDHPQQGRTNSSSSLSSISDLPLLELDLVTVTFVPHLAVHLKDLTWSQELSGVEEQWREDAAEMAVDPNAATVATSSPSYQVTAEAESLHACHTHSEPDVNNFSEIAAAFITASITNRITEWRCVSLHHRHRTIRIVHVPLVFLPSPTDAIPFRSKSLAPDDAFGLHAASAATLTVFPSLLPSHAPALYTLLQVHLLTHVLPESELLQMSYQLEPRVDRTKVRAVQTQKKTLTALQEEGFI